MGAGVGAGVGTGAPLAAGTAATGEGMVDGVPEMEDAVPSLPPPPPPQAAKKSALNAINASTRETRGDVEMFTLAGLIAHLRATSLTGLSHPLARLSLVGK